MLRTVRFKIQSADFYYLMDSATHDRMTLPAYLRLIVEAFVADSQENDKHERTAGNGMEADQPQR